MAKILEMPKSNAQLWSDLFASFCRDIDKVAAHQKEQQVSCPQPTKAVNHEGGTGAVANRKPPIEANNGGAGQSFSAPFQPSVYVGEDGGYIPDWRDEEPWSDTQTRLEQMNSIKGR